MTPEPNTVDFDAMPDGAQHHAGEAPAIAPERIPVPVSTPAMGQLPRNGSRLATGGGDDDMLVEFYFNPVTGQDHCKMSAPGETRYAEWDQPVREQDKRRFPHAWNAFCTNSDQFEGQTRLEECAWVDPGLRNVLQHNGVHTMEHLAGVKDSTIHAIGPGVRQLRERAAQEVAAKNDASEASELRAQVAALSKQVQALTEAKKPRSRRKAQPETAAA